MGARALINGSRGTAVERPQVSEDAPLKYRDYAAASKP
jgi:hypothetical protein